MKKIYAFAVIGMFCFANANAQFTKGQKLLGGSLGFSVEDVDQKPYQNYTNKNYSVTVSPTFGCFISDKQLVGFSAKYQRYDYKQITPNTYAQENVDEAAGASLYTQYFFPVVNRLYFTLKGTGGVDYLFGKTLYTTNGGETDNRHHGFEVKVALAPGLSYQVNRRFLFDLSLNDLAYASYSRTVSKYVTPSSDSKSIDKNFKLASSLSSTLSNVGLGFRWLIK